MALPTANYPTGIWDGNEQANPPENPDLPAETTKAHASDRNEIASEVVAMATDLRTAFVNQGRTSVDDMVQDLQTQITDVEYRTVKTVLENRVSTGTISDDTDLVQAITKTGSHLIRVVLFVNQESTAAGFQVRLNYDDTISGSVLSITENGVDNGSFNFSSSNSANEAINSTVSFTMGSIGDYVVTLEGWVNITQPGNLSVQWAQLVSDANDTFLNPGSQMIIKPV